MKKNYHRHKKKNSNTDEIIKRMKIFLKQDKDKGIKGYLCHKTIFCYKVVSNV